jgi:hypothetical protein
MSVKHSPGPWKAKHSRISNADIWIGQAELIMGNPDRTAANARLMAAAPELLAALKALTENIRDVGAHNCPGFDCNRCQAPEVGWAAAYEAIAKAEGKS